MNRVYGPTDAWPEHQDDFWRDTLDACRAAGWTLQTKSGHSWGRVECPAKVCRGLTVYSTGRGSENAAKDLLKMVRRCEHGPAGGRQEPSRRSQALQRLATAEALIESVEERLELVERHSDAEARLDTLLVDMDTQLDTAELLVSLDDVEAAFDALGDLEPVPARAEIATDIDAAGVEVEETMASVPRSLSERWRTEVVGPAEELLHRVGLVRARLAAL